MQPNHRRVFRPGIVPTIATLALAPTLAALGFWQLSRAEDKQILIDNFEQAAAKAPATTDLSAIDPKKHRYQRIALSGTFDATHQVLLDAITLQGQAGFEVLTPLKLEGTNSAVMVNRGWVAATGERRPADDLQVDTQARQLRGAVDRFSQPGIKLGDNAPQSGWPRMMLFPQAADISEALGYPVLEWQLLLDASEPDGFERQWQPATEFGPERHIGYAVQWFALCATLLIIYIVVNYKHEDT